MVTNENDIEKYFALIHRMTLAENKIDGVYYYLARHLGINENTLALLYALDDGRPHSQKEICEEWLIPKTTINSIVKKMTAQGYITLQTEPHSREKNLILTEQGRERAEQLLGNIYKAEEKAMREALQKYSPEFIEALEYFADCFCKGYYELTDRYQFRRLNCYANSTKQDKIQ